ncbi:APC family permease [Pseudonocardia xishanensis]|uniref:APC family permease n=1 Tax=Pseudonocardia xishanensis TaxID=630995 RepID=A0ABP8RSR7_9PSEU
MTGAQVRRLGPGDSVVIGLASMLGAGVFSAFGPAAAAAGSGMLVALVIAGIVAYCNATSSARLAARHPQSGGTYVYGRRRLGPVWGFTAGWGFVVGKTASCAAMALTFGAYVWPAHPSVPAVVVVLLLTAVNLLGVTRTALAARVLLALTLATLVLVVAAGLAGGHTAPVEAPTGGPLGVLQAAGLLFFAFAGYARITTLGGEVRDPARTIPRAVAIALGAVLVVYALVGTTALLVLGPAGLAGATAPLVQVATAGGLAAAEPVVRVGAAAACAGVLLTLVAGVGRTLAAMAADGELPRALAPVDRRTGVPRRAELAVGLVAVTVVLTADLRGAIGFAGVGVLVYYAIANAAALTLGPGRRAVAVAGLVGCVVLVVTLPVEAVLVGAAVFAVGLEGRAVRMRLG